MSKKPSNKEYMFIEIAKLPLALGTPHLDEHFNKGSDSGRKYPGVVELDDRYGHVHGQCPFRLDDDINIPFGNSSMDEAIQKITTPEEVEEVYKFIKCRVVVEYTGDYDTATVAEAYMMVEYYGPPTPKMVQLYTKALATSKAREEQIVAERTAAVRARMEAELQAREAAKTEELARIDLAIAELQKAKTRLK